MYIFPKSWAVFSSSQKQGKKSMFTLKITVTHRISEGADYVNHSPQRKKPLLETSHMLLGLPEFCQVFAEGESCLIKPAFHNLWSSAERVLWQSVLSIWYFNSPDFGCYECTQRFIREHGWQSSYFAISPSYYSSVQQTYWKVTRE